MSDELIASSAERDIDVPLAKLLEAAPDAMIVVDERGTIVYVNGEAEQIFGYAREELFGRSVDVLTPVEIRDRHKGQRDRYTRNPHGRPMGQALNIMARRKDGTEFPADIKLSPLTTPRGLLVTAALRDISLQRQTEERLRTYARHLEVLQADIGRKNVELEQRNRELEQFAYVSSHDLQEPLRKIVAFGDRLKERCSEALDDRGRDYLERMQSAARRMQLLVSDLLEFSRLTTRGKPFEVVKLDQVVQAALSDLEVAIERSGGKIDVGELATIDGDSVQMRQLFQNLLGNALKFHGKGVPPRVKIWGRVEDAGEAGAPAIYELHVEDNGIGIDPKYSERIFTVFERLNPRAEYEGTGIGLAICKKIAERHHGSIQVKSEPGRGSDFVIRLPMTHPSRTDGAGKNMKPQQAEAAPARASTGRHAGET
ncbi:ATP-binding protein [Sorangium sp. So ce295]|jgi:two-component system sensor kinase FixL|uniref:sensor histidine kinase n=1 Tax=Sorangium sp. So ce295 TaxID=3133295 RepID=UPI003F5FAD5E